MLAFPTKVLNKEVILQPNKEVYLNNPLIVINTGPFTVVREADNEADSYISNPNKGTEKMKIQTADLHLEAKNQTEVNLHLLAVSWE